MSAPTPLLSNWTAPVPTTRGLFPLGDGKSLPSGWGPQPGSYSAVAFPTPFARAEAMRAVLASLGSSPSPHQYFHRFRLMVLGVALGRLRLEVLDLEDTRKTDNFGRALRRAEPIARYLARVILPTDNGAVCFGLSHPTCLFWPHARRNPDDWNRLRVLLDADETEALALLADWRASLLAGRLWDERKPLPWQRGIQVLLGTQEPTPGLAKLHDDSRFVGPVCLTLAATGDKGDEARVGPVYFPVLDRGFARRWVAHCMTQPQREEARDASEHPGIAFRDQRSTLFARVELPEAVNKADPIALGAGIVHEPPVSVLARGESKRLWTVGEGNKPGLVSLMESVSLALRALDRPVEKTVIDTCPSLYPDPLRVLVRANLWPVDGGGALLHSQRCQQVFLASQSGHRLPNAAELRAPKLGFVAHFGPSDKRFQMAFVEQHEGLDVGDLRALGAVLFHVFVGEAKVEAGLNQLTDRELRPLLESTNDRPFECAPAAYRLVLGPELAAPYSRRLATLQRLLATYKTRAALARSEPEGEHSVWALFDAAVQCFALWAHGGNGVRAMGREGSFETDVKLATGETLALAVDGFAVRS